jgi:serine protein kinase
MESELLKWVDQFVHREFEANRRVLSFAEYLAIFQERPAEQVRNTAGYLADMMDHFGRTPAPGKDTDQARSQSNTGLDRFGVFDLPIDGITQKVVGHERVQHQLYRALRGFARQGFNNKLLLLHGPNGSAKSSLIHALMNGAETYSKKTEGALYGIHWVFPVERSTKSGMGLNQYDATKANLETYAKLSDDELSSRVSCELKDHPFQLIPVDTRKDLLKRLLGDSKGEALWKTLPHTLQQGDLCHRCKQIAETLLNSYQGDYKRVLMHVQVERFFLSRRYRKGLVTIEPQMHVDAQYHQLSYNRSLGALPASLQSLNFFSLSGDLIDGNRGITEYSDLLKRPMDAFKYLLTACETGSLNIGSAIASLDTVMLGSTNEIQLDAFKEFPDFMSFKGRIELIRVPYLLSVSQEQEIYEPIIKQIAGEKHVTPHAVWAASLWAVLTRLKKPNSINYPSPTSALVSQLTPLEKAKLYDRAELPPQMAAEDRKVLRANLKRVYDEYLNTPFYEGRVGASAREIKSLLMDAAQNREFSCLSPLAVLRGLEDLVKRTSEYEFLRQDVKDGYHDNQEFINSVRNDYINVVDREVRDCIGLYDTRQWEEFIRKYVQQISLVRRKEKQKNPITGKLEDPDFALIQEFEKIVEGPDSDSERDAFRQMVISQIGAWSLDHPGEPVSYSQVFPEYWRKLERHYYESQKALLTKMHDAILVYGSDPSTLTAAKPGEENTEGMQLAQKTIENLKEKFGYCEHCAKEVITFLMKSRY